MHIVLGTGVLHVVLSNGLFTHREKAIFVKRIAANPFLTIDAQSSYSDIALVREKL